VTVLSASGRRLAAIALPPGGRAAAAAYSPQGRVLAVLRRDADASEVVLLRARLVAVLSRNPGRLTGLAWSPDGRFVLVGWESADEWLFLPVGGGKPRAVGEIAAEFSPGEEDAGFPRIEGWVSPP
jgi:hypothetical protein